MSRKGDYDPYKYIGPNGQVVIPPAGPRNANAPTTPTPINDAVTPVANTYAAEYPVAPTGTATTNPPLAARSAATGFIRTPTTSAPTTLTPISSKHTTGSAAVVNPRLAAAATGVKRSASGDVLANPHGAKMQRGDDSQHSTVHHLSSAVHQLSSTVQQLATVEQLASAVEQLTSTVEQQTSTIEQLKGELADERAKAAEERAKAEKRAKVKRSMMVLHSKIFDSLGTMLNEQADALRRDADVLLRDADTM